MLLPVRPFRWRTTGKMIYLPTPPSIKNASHFSSILFGLCRNKTTNNASLSPEATTKWVLPEVSEGLRWFHWPGESTSFGPIYVDPASSQKCVIDVKTWARPIAKGLSRGSTTDDKDCAAAKVHVRVCERKRAEEGGGGLWQPS